MASNVNVMDVIIISVLLLFVGHLRAALVSVLDHEQESALRDLRPQIPHLVDFPFLFSPPFSQSSVPTVPSVSLHTMAPRKTKRSIELSSAAAPAAVGQLNVKDASRSRRSDERPVASSRTRSKVTILGPLRILNLETYQLI